MQSAPRQSTLAIITVITGLALALPALALKKNAPTLIINIPTVKLTELGQSGQYITIPWIAQYLVGIYQYAIYAAAVLAVIMMMWGGFQWLTSAGDASKVGAAKKRLENAAIGLMILMSAYVIFTMVNPAMTALMPLKVETVQKQLLPPGKKPIPSSVMSSLAATGHGATPQRVPLTASSSSCDPCVTSCPDVRVTPVCP